MMLTVEKYQEQAANCDNLCIIETKPETKLETKMPCVTCPFCKEVVTAILTENTISCPECKVTVNR